MNGGAHRPRPDVPESGILEHIAAACPRGSLLTAGIKRATVATFVDAGVERVAVEEVLAAGSGLRLPLTCQQRYRCHLEKNATQVPAIKYRGGSRDRAAVEADLLVARI